MGLIKSHLVKRNGKLYLKLGTRPDVRSMGMTSQSSFGCAQGIDCATFDCSQVCQLICQCLTYCNGDTPAEVCVDFITEIHPIEPVGGIVFGSPVLAACGHCDGGPDCWAVCIEGISGDGPCVSYNGSFVLNPASVLDASTECAWAKNIAPIAGDCPTCNFGCATFTFSNSTPVVSCTNCDGYTGDWCVTLNWDYPTPLTTLDHLTANMTASDTTMSVNYGFALAGYHIVLIDSEQILLSFAFFNASVHIATRGYNGTTPASHLTGATIYLYRQCSDISNQLHDDSFTLKWGGAISPQWGSGYDPPLYSGGPTLTLTCNDPGTFVSNNPAVGVFSYSFVLAVLWFDLQTASYIRVWFAVPMTSWNCSGENIMPVLASSGASCYLPTSATVTPGTCGSPFAFTAPRPSIAPTSDQDCNVYNNTWTLISDGNANASGCSWSTFLSLPSNGLQLPMKLKLMNCNEDPSLWIWVLTVSFFAPGQGINGTYAVFPMTWQGFGKPVNNQITVTLVVNQPSYCSNYPQFITITLGCDSSTDWYCVEGIILPTGSGEWTAPPGITNIAIEMFGAGGSSGWQGKRVGGGGGGGAYGSWNAIPVVPGQPYYYTVGAGGTNQSDGGDTTWTDGFILAFATYFFTASGGKCPSGLNGGGLSGLSYGLGANAAIGTLYAPTVAFKGGDGGSGMLISTSNGSLDDEPGIAGGGGGGSGSPSLAGASGGHAVYTGSGAYAPNSGIGGIGGSAGARGGGGGSGASSLFPSYAAVSGQDGMAPGGGAGGGGTSGDSQTWAGADGKIVITTNSSPNYYKLGCQTLNSTQLLVLHDLGYTVTGPFSSKSACHSQCSEDITPDAQYYQLQLFYTSTNTYGSGPGWYLVMQTPTQSIIYFLSDEEWECLGPNTLNLITTSITACSGVPSQLTVYNCTEVPSCGVSIQVSGGLILGGSPAPPAIGFDCDSYPFWCVTVLGVDGPSVCDGIDGSYDLSLLFGCTWTYSSIFTLFYTASYPTGGSFDPSLAGFTGFILYIEIDGITSSYILSLGSWSFTLPNAMTYHDSFTTTSGFALVSPTCSMPVTVTVTSQECPQAVIANNGLVFGGTAVVAESGTGPQPITVSLGGLVFGGNAPIYYAILPPTGGLVLAGTASVSGQDAAQGVSPSGGLILGGDALLKAKLVLPISAGGIKLAGNPIASSNNKFNPTGGISFAGTGGTALYGNAIQFAGTLTSLMTASDTGMPSGTSDRSFSMWCKFAVINPAASGAAMLQYGTFPGGFGSSSAVIMLCGNNVTFNMCSDTCAGNTGNNLLLITNKFHLVWRETGGTWSLYLNAAHANPFPSPFGTSVNTVLSGVLKMGLNYPLTLQDIRVYNRLLSDAEVSGIYNGGVQSLAAGTTSGLTTWWKTNEGTGTTVADFIGGNNGTLANATWVTM